MLEEEIIEKKNKERKDDAEWRCQKRGGAEA